MEYAHLVHAEALVDLPPVLVALALLARLPAVAAPAAQVALLPSRHAAVVLPRVANVLQKHKNRCSHKTLFMTREEESLHFLAGLEKVLLF